MHHAPSLSIIAEIAILIFTLSIPVLLGLVLYSIRDVYRYIGKLEEGQKRNTETVDRIGIGSNTTTGEVILSKTNQENNNISD